MSVFVKASRMSPEEMGRLKDEWDNPDNQWANRDSMYFNPVEEQLLDEVEDVFAHNDMPGSVNSPADANRWLHVIGKLQMEMDGIVKEGNEVVAETKAFYQKKRDSKQRTIDFFASKIEAYVRATDKNLSLPNGKAGLRRRKKVHWASDEKLLAYCKANGIETKVTEKAIKANIKKFVGDGESTVFTTEEVVDFNINV